MEMNEPSDERITSPMMRRLARYRNILKTRKVRSTFSPLSALRLCSREDPEMATTSTTARKTMTKSNLLKPSAKKVHAPRPIIFTATSTAKKKVKTKLVTTSERSSPGSMPWCSTAMSTVLR